MEPEHLPGTGEPWQNAQIQDHSHLLLSSFAKVTGRTLISASHDLTISTQTLYEAPFIVLSHNTDADPTFNYANRAAQNLWEADWDTFIKMPSRLSAEPVHQAERTRLLAEAAQKGFINNYEGVRIATSGKRFLIQEAIIWNLTNHDGSAAGQAATFSKWNYLPE